MPKTACSEKAAKLRRAEDVLRDIGERLEHCPQPRMSTEIRQLLDNYWKRSTFPSGAKPLNPLTHYRDAQGMICEVDLRPPLDPELLVSARVFGQQLRGIGQQRLREVLDALCAEANKTKET